MINPFYAEGPVNHNNKTTTTTKESTFTT